MLRVLNFTWLHEVVHVAVLFPAPWGDSQKEAVSSWSQFSLLPWHLCYRFTCFWESEGKAEAPEIISNSCRLRWPLGHFSRMSLGWPTCANLFASLWETNDPSKLNFCAYKLFQVNVAWKMLLSVPPQLWDSRPKCSKKYLVQELWQIFQNYYYIIYILLLILFQYFYILVSNLITLWT